MIVCHRPQRRKQPASIHNFQILNGIVQRGAWAPALLVEKNEHIGQEQPDMFIFHLPEENSASLPGAETLHREQLVDETTPGRACRRHPP